MLKLRWSMPFFMAMNHPAPAGLVLAGLYGLEVVADGERRDHPQSGNWREVIDDVAGRADEVERATEKDLVAGDAGEVSAGSVKAGDEPEV